MEQTLSPIQYAQLKKLLQYHDYVAISRDIQQEKLSLDSRFMLCLELAQAIMMVNIPKVNELSKRIGTDAFVADSLSKQKSYCYLQAMTIKLIRREYSDYLRGLTPLLVDVLRVLIEHDFLPTLSQYMEPVEKETEQGDKLYRGIQWSKEKIEADDNLIRRAWQKYYGDYFNYDHYVSSSHLIKLIETYSKNSQIIELTATIRQIEKYLRNLVAHEVVYVDEAFFQARIGYSPQQVHQLLIQLFNVAGMTDDKQLYSIKGLNNTLNQYLDTQINE
ncbi:hypothetical protein [Tuanshanicoccus lijuaniae]|uniref:hypothetical protein n=1 Tax=Aerococcaceae bacterium zg-1292 TaxID=2774330 RepID=UPI001BD8D95E|nr:hypothetical protein [Aerococcaceae bacterium zg-A91]MBS4458888.1 hypothetical protein [Aerococcaceae bacterium zg-BR33]